MPNTNPDGITTVILAVGNSDSQTSSTFTLQVREEATVMVYPYGSVGSDVAQLQRQDPAGTWVQCTDDNGDIDLSDTRTTEVIIAPGTYRFNVPTRTSSWGIAITR